MQEIRIRQSRFEISVTWALVFLAMCPALISGPTSIFAWLHMLFIAALAALALEGARRLHRLAGTMLFGLITTFLMVEITCYRITGLHLNAFTLGLLFEGDALTNIGVSVALPLAIVLVFGASLFLALRRKHPPRRFRLRWLGLVALGSLLLSQLGYALFYFYAVPGVMETRRKLALFDAPHPYTAARLLTPLLGPREDHSFALSTDTSSTASAQLPDITPSRTPDILLVVMDSVRSKDILRTPGIAPTLTGLQARGQLSLAHYSASNCTHFSMFSMLTGQLPNHFGTARQNRKPMGIIPILERAGYKATSAEALSLDWYDIAQMLLTGADRYVADGGTLRKRDRFVTDTSIEILKESDENPRFHLAYYNGAHFPYGDEFPLIGVVGGTLESYQNAISEMDSELARLIAPLEARVKAGKLIIIITADHGESIEDGGITGHSSAMTEEQTVVPLGVLGAAAGELPASQAGLYGYILSQLGIATAHHENPVVLSNCGVEVPRGFAVISGNRRADFIYEDGFLSPTPSPDGKMPPKAEQLKAAKSLLKALTETP